MFGITKTLLFSSPSQFLCKVWRLIFQWSIHGFGKEWFTTQVFVNIRLKKAFKLWILLSHCKFISYKCKVNQFYVQEELRIIVVKHIIVMLFFFSFGLRFKSFRATCSSKTPITNDSPLCYQSRLSAAMELYKNWNVLVQYCLILPPLQFYRAMGNIFTREQFRK